MYYGDENADKLQRRYRKFYSEDGGMEITNDTQAGSTSFVFYLDGDAYSAPAIWKEVHTSSANAQNLYFLHRDHLGSILMITDAQGEVKEKRQFDAWGNIVKIEDGNGNPLTAFVILDRGYTGHEHLMGVALIHMNGRLYDPMLHRFLAPDNFVQDASNTQNFNRYGYVMNNPLKYTDPSGEVFWLIPALIGGTINWATHGFQFNAKGLGYFAVGAAAGALGAGVGKAVTAAINVGGFAGGAMVGAAAGGAGGFVGGAGNAWVGGANFWSGLGSGLKAGITGAIGGGIVGGTLAGIDAVRNDSNFWDGSVEEFGGYEGAGKFLDEKIPAGHKPTATGEIARTEHNPNYGKYGPKSRTYPPSKGGGPKPHFGVDYSGKVGDDVYSMYDGTVTQIGKSGVYGENFVRTSSAINGKTYNVDYGHMSKHFTLNKNITAGKLIGYMGRMGNNFPASMPTHVHISVWRPVNGLQGFVMPWWK